MPSKCYGCGKQSRGDMPKATIKGEERSYCADCLWKLDKEYKQKKACEECAYFSKDRCKKTEVSLTPVSVGFNTYFVQAENCNYFAVDTYLRCLVGINGSLLYSLLTADLSLFLDMHHFLISAFGILEKTSYHKGNSDYAK